MKSDCFLLSNNNHKFKSYAKMATREQCKANSTIVQKNARVSKVFFRRLRPYPLYITRALAGLLNQWDFAVQTVSRQPLSQSAWLSSRSGSSGLWSSELGVKILRKGYLMP